jgi:16S rRNA (uracil1498-N3)-methyltransferase
VARGEKALGKWQRTAREAAKQSRRAWIPSVTGPAGLDDVRRLVSGAECAVVLEASAAVPLSRLALPGSGSIVLIVGPEGGITPDERTGLVAAGALEARLGPTVLRTSTAGAAAAAVLLTRSGRWLSRRPPGGGTPYGRRGDDRPRGDRVGKSRLGAGCRMLEHCWSAILWRAS